MLYKMKDNVYRLIVTFPMGMGDVNSYLIEGKNGFTVVDTGANLKEARETWERVIHSGINIEKVVVTHTHEDHVGLAKWFQESLQVPVIIPKIGIEEMKKVKEFTGENFKEFIMKYDGPEPPINFLGNSADFDFIPDGTFGDNEKLLLGDDYYETIWTPGHAADQFCFYNREKNILIVGDHILRDISPVVGVWNEVDGNPLKQYFKSLERMKPYTPDISLPGHGEPIYQLQERVNELQTRHEERLEEVYGIIQEEYKSATQICEEIYGTLNIIIDLSAFMATLTRCLYLEDIGKIERKVMNDVFVFKAIN